MSMKIFSVKYNFIVMVIVFMELYIYYIKEANAYLYILLQIFSLIHLNMMFLSYVRISTSTHTHAIKNDQLYKLIIGNGIKS